MQIYVCPELEAYDQDNMSAEKETSGFLVLSFQKQDTLQRQFCCYYSCEKLCLHEVLAQPVSGTNAHFLNAELVQLFKMDDSW